MLTFFFFFFNDTATTEIYTLSLHDALPILIGPLADDHVAALGSWAGRGDPRDAVTPLEGIKTRAGTGAEVRYARSEEHTSELQSLAYLVCRLLLEKKKKQICCSPLRTTRCH